MGVCTTTIRFSSVIHPLASLLTSSSVIDGSSRLDAGNRLAFEVRPDVLVRIDVGIGLVALGVCPLVEAQQVRLCPVELGLEEPELVHAARFDEQGFESALDAAVRHRGAQRKWRQLAPDEPALRRAGADERRVRSLGDFAETRVEHLHVQLDHQVSPVVANGARGLSRQLEQQVDV
jgi:hypothetical protein